MKKNLIVITHEHFLGDCICAEPVVAAIWRHHHEEYKIIVNTRWPELWADYPYMDGTIRPWENQEGYREFLIARTYEWGHLVFKVAETLKLELEHRVPKLFFLGSASRCSHPGCGYADGKPCHGCGHMIAEAGAPYVAICGDASESGREWDDARWSVVCDAIHQLGYKVVQLGKKGRPIAGVDDCLLNQTSVTQAARIIKHSAAFVTVDSGLSHLSASVGKPYIVLMNNLPNELRDHAGFTTAINVGDIKKITAEQVIETLKEKLNHVRT